MMNICLIFLFMLFFNIQSLLSQSIAIDLSLSWSKSQLNISEKFDTIKHPYLCVTYSNLTQDSVYMPKTIYGCRELPLILSWEYPKITEIKSLDDLETMLSTYRKYSDEEKFDIQLDFVENTLFVNKHTDCDEIESFDFYNRNLERIYHFVAQKNGFSYQVKTYLSSKERMDDPDRYLFFNPGEVIVEKYDLIAFEMLRGKYTFYYNKIPCKTSVVEEDRVYDFHFEERKNGYRLECGTVISDSLTIGF
jgi:hypothetical protein